MRPLKPGLWWFGVPAAVFPARGTMVELGLLDGKDREVTAASYHRMRVQVEGLSRGGRFIDTVRFPVAVEDWGPVHSVGVFEPGALRPFLSRPWEPKNALGSGDVQYLPAYVGARSQVVIMPMLEEG